MSENIINFSDEEKKIMRDTLLKCFTTLLPQIINEITPLILKQSQIIATKKDVNQDRKVETQVEDNESVLAQGLQLISERQNFWSILLDTREDRFCKLTRDEMLLNLYKEGLQETPVYVPRKFRVEGGNTVSEIEGNHDISTKRLGIEIDTLEIRCKNMKKELNAIDSKIKIEILNLTARRSIVYAVMNDINQKIKKSNERIQTRWLAEMDKLRNAYIQDRKVMGQKADVPKASVPVADVRKADVRKADVPKVVLDCVKDINDNVSSISTDVVPLAALRDESDGPNSSNENDLKRDKEKWEDEINRIRKIYRSKRNRYKEHVLNQLDDDLDIMNVASISRGFDISSPLNSSDFKSRYGNLSSSTSESTLCDDKDFGTTYFKLADKLKCEVVSSSKSEISSIPHLNSKPPLRYSVRRRLEP